MSEEYRFPPNWGKLRDGTEGADPSEMFDVLALRARIARLEAENRDLRQQIADEIENYDWPLPILPPGTPGRDYARQLWLAVIHWLRTGERI